jgi:hypothetical protein
MASTAAYSSVAARPSAELVSFARRQIRNARANECLFSERRSEARLHLAVPVLVRPLDDDFNPVGEYFSAVTRDISPSGVGLIAEQPISYRHVVLRMHLANEEVTVIAEVKWHKPMGPFEGIGCRFVRKSHETPPLTRPRFCCSTSR